MANKQDKPAHKQKQKQQATDQYRQPGDKQNKAYEQDPSKSKYQDKNR